MITRSHEFGIVGRRCLRCEAVEVEVARPMAVLACVTKLRHSLSPFATRKYAQAR